MTKSVKDIQREVKTTIKALTALCDEAFDLASEHKRNSDALNEELYKGKTLAYGIALELVKNILKTNVKSMEEVEKLLEGAHE